MKDTKHREIIEIDAFLQENNFELGAAIAKAANRGSTVIRFGPGVYFLKKYETVSTISIAHDDGCGDIKEKDCHVYLSEIEDLTLEGTCLQDGTPATTLAGLNTQNIQTLLPSILWAVNCPGLILRNLAFTREPECASAGQIERIDDGNIYVRVFQGNPCYDGMAAYCMNRFTLQNRELLGESLTFGFGYENRFVRLEENLLMLKDERIARQVHVGEGLSWHQAGKTDFQLFFGNCDNLTLDNIRIYNTNSFALLTENCCNITAKNLVMKPKGNQFFTGPRDGWKIYRCTGKIQVEDCHIEGVRMDGQNIHSNFMIVEKILSDKELICVCKYAPISLRNGYEMEFYNGAEMKELRIERWEILGGYKEGTTQSMDESATPSVPNTVHHMTLYRITLEERLPEFVEKGTLMTPRCWEPTEYYCTNSVFRNIAGAGHLLRCGEVEITGCTYEHIMNAGILIGAELDTHCEGGHGVNVVIKNNVFSNCGTKARYGEYGCGCIAVKSQGFDTPVNQNIIIENNIFKNSKRALEIRDAREVKISNNQYENIQEKIAIEEKSTKGIRLDDCSVMD